MPKAKTTLEFIIDAKLKHGDKYEYDSVEYKNCSTKVEIWCNTCEKYFEQRPNDHLKGSNCKTCAVIKRSNSSRKTVEQFIEESKSIHGEKYDYSQVEYKSSKDKVTIFCIKCQISFDQTPEKHLSGQGCRKCGIENRNECLRKTLQEFIDDAKNVHGDKYDYSKVKYKSCVDKVIIACNACYLEFPQTPSAHLSGQGCPDCGMKKYKDAQRKTLTEFIEQAQGIHGDKYDYSKVDYKAHHEHVLIICNTCYSIFSQMASQHLNGRGCHKCGGTTKKTLEQFIIDAKLIHGDKYDYTNVEYKTAHINVEIICKKCTRSFPQTPTAHIDSKAGCPRCAKTRGYSKQSIAWLDFLQKVNNMKIQHAENEGEYRLPETKKKVDGYCKETREIFEFHGDYWHGNPMVYEPEFENQTTYCTMGELYKKTMQRQKRFEDLGYKVHVMWEYDWKNLEKTCHLIQSKFRAKKLTRTRTVYNEFIINTKRKLGD